MQSAPEIPRERWFAMTRLDENRAKAQLAKKAGVGISAVSNLGVWGNHSPTMFPDFYHAKINGQPVTSVIQDENWLKTDFVTTVAQRGTSVLNARKAGSAASAANAAIDSVKSIITPTAPNDWHSVSVCSDGSYGIEAGLLCSFPVRSDGKKLQIVQGLESNEFSRGKIDASVNELKGEKAMAAELGLAK
jgi:malate dehydrogenase